MKPETTISIVSGGWSAGQVDLSKVPGLVIGVNSASLHAPKLDVALSMDRKWSEAHWPWFWARDGAIKVWLRESAARNIVERPDWLTVFKCDHRSFTMSTEPGTLDGTNSGGCALNLAYSKRPRTVYLFGFDYRVGPKGQLHWFEAGSESGLYGSGPIDARRYSNWAGEFIVAAHQFKAAGIDVVNVSDISVITAFRKVSPRHFAKVAA